MDQEWTDERCWWEGEKNIIGIKGRWRKEEEKMRKDEKCQSKL